MTREIELSQGYVTLVDDDDYEDLMQTRWHVQGARRADGTLGNVYAVRNYLRYDGKVRLEYMHRYLLPGAEQVDHIDCNGLNNQRANLRPATSAQNHQNQRPRGGTSRYKGVSRRGGIWRAYIKVDKQQRGLGTYHDEEEAARAYDRAAIHYFGEFARTNFEVV